MEIAKLTLVSNNIGYGPIPQPDDEVEQRLTINAAGQVWFTGYAFGEGFGKYTACRKGRLNIGTEKAQNILGLVGSYFTEDYLCIRATDVGEWKLTATDTFGTKHIFEGSLCADLQLGDVAVSSEIQKCIPIADLFLFDGGEDDE